MSVQANARKQEGQDLEQRIWHQVALMAVAAQKLSSRLSRNTPGSWSKMSNIS